MVFEWQLVPLVSSELEHWPWQGWRSLLAVDSSRAKRLEIQVVYIRLGTEQFPEYLQPEPNLLLSNALHWIVDNLPQ